MQQEVRVLFFQFITVVAAFSMLLTLPSQAQTEKIIYSFSGGTDGLSPAGGVVLDSNGNLYGVTEGGGANAAGTVFKLPQQHRHVDQNCAVLLRPRAR